MFNFGGSMLTGAEIERQIKKGKIQISPYDPKLINPNSYNLRLHPQLLIYERDSERANILPPNTVSIKECKASITPLRGFTINEDFTDTANETIPCNPSVVYSDGVSVIESSGMGIDKNTKITPIQEEPWAEKVDMTFNSVQDAHMLICNRFEEKIEDVYEHIGDTYNYINNELKTLHDLSNISSTELPPIDMMKKNKTLGFMIPPEGYVLQPGVLYIGRTIERTSTDKFIPMINGRSSGGRLGISIHITAGFGDIGFDGTWTLEITCVEPVRIYPNVPIAQVCYFKPSGKIKSLYNGRYNKQIDATASRFFKNRGETLNG